MQKIIPGPDRKRTPAEYEYRVIYRQPAAAPGCRIIWEVIGGRAPYQIAVEQTDRGQLRWHCTCADAVYRGEREANHVCKHIRGLVGPNPPTDGG